MNREDRVTLLVESLRSAAIKTKEEQDQAAQIAWVTALVTAKLAEKKAETSKSLVCPHCNKPLPESWRTDDTTSSTQNDDDVNEQDDDPDSEDDDRELDAAGKSRVLAELLARKRRC